MGWRDGWRGNGSSCRHGWVICMPLAKVGRETRRHVWKQAGNLPSWPAEKGVLDSGDAGFRRHIALTLSVGYAQVQCAFSAKG